MEKIFFDDLSEEATSRGTRWMPSIDEINHIKNEWGNNEILCESVEQIEQFLTKKNDAGLQEYNKRVNDVKSLLRKYWKVSYFTPVEEGSDICRTKEICYMYPYDMNTCNDRIFVLVSTIDINDFIYSRRRALGEISLDYMKLDGLLFEETTKEEMIENAKKMCDSLFEHRFEKIKEHEKNENLAALDRITTSFLSENPLYDRD